MVLGSLSLLGGGGQEWELPPHQSLATFGSRTFLSIFLPFTPRGLSLKGALWLTQLPAPTPLPLGPLVYLSSARLQMLHRPPWALPATGVERCGLGT